MMSPRMRAGEVTKLLSRLIILAGGYLLLNGSLFDQRLRQFSNKLNAIDYRVEVFFTITGTFLEVVEIDFGSLPRIARSKADFAAPVIRVRLQHGPCQIVESGGEDLRIGGEVSLEAPQKRHTKQIRKRPTSCGPLEHGEHRSVGDVRSCSGLFPLFVLRISSVKARPFEDAPLLLRDPVNHSHLVAILQVLAHTLKVYLNGNPVPFQLLARPNSRKHQQLRCVERAATQYHFP